MGGVDEDVGAGLQRRLHAVAGDRHGVDAGHLAPAGLDHIGKTPEAADVLGVDLAGLVALDGLRAAWPHAAADLEQRDVAAGAPIVHGPAAHADPNHHTLDRGDI